MQKVEPIVLSVTLSELVSMMEARSAKRSKEASLALAVAQEFPVIEVKRKTEEEVDDAIQRVAVDQQWSVATNDRFLRRKLRDNNVTTIFVRQKSHLEGR
jgi:rRNA-processing protein FCF1